MVKSILYFAALAVGLSAQAPVTQKRSVLPGPAVEVDPSGSEERPAPPQPSANLLAAASSTGTGILYTCDATITALSSTLCSTLNTTIAGLYSSAFTNANATIYIKLGNTSLGASDSYLNDFSYATFRSLLISAASDQNDNTAIADSVPPLSPFGNSFVSLGTALQRALGLPAPTVGITPSGGECNQNGAVGCYDGLITISNTQPLYLRSGAITSRQYDFFTVVEHETDEILGTSSCAFRDCFSTDVAPADFFRYHSDGSRAQGEGTNDPCTSSDSTNACFSLDGVHMLQQYNNLSGDDAGDWVVNCNSPHVQDEESCSGNSYVDISPTAEVVVLDVVGYTLRSSYVQISSSANTQTVWLAPGSLASAYGTDLATSLFGSTSLPLPTGFGGTSVTIRDSSGATSLAPLLYVSTTQVNFLVPSTVVIGAAQVTITSGDGKQSLANVQIAHVGPGVFTLNSAGLAAADVVLYHANGTQTVEQVYSVTNSGAVVANPVSLGSSTDQAYLFLFGTGIQAAGTSGVKVSVNGNNLPIQFAGTQGGFAGLDQVNVQLPSSLVGKGNVTIQLTANGYAANPVNLTIQ
jgi:uncharacterized protein (TIGR03437 family)